MSTDFLHSHLGHNPSYTWRSVHASRDLVRRGTRWKVGNGDQVHFWGDSWVDDDRSFSIATPPVPTFEDMLVKDFFVPGTRNWNMEVINVILSTDVRTGILQTISAPNNVMDTQICHFTASGIYTVKSAYYLKLKIINDRWDFGESRWVELWKHKIPPRISSFFWRLCKGFLVVKAKTQLCPVCGEVGLVESVWHLFIDCKVVRSCWRITDLWRCLDELCHEVEDHADFFMCILHNFAAGDVNKMMGVSWALWRNRNNIVWRDESSTSAQIVYSARVAVDEWRAIRVPNLVDVRATTCTKWHFPPTGFARINVDASFFADDLLTGIGMVLISDGEGNFIAARTMVKEGLMRVADGEAWGVLEALNWAALMDLRKLVIETDAQRVSVAYNSDEQNYLSFGDFIEAGKAVIANRNQYLVRWVTRNANKTTHYLARISRPYESPYYWDELPNSVEDLHDICKSCK